MTLLKNKLECLSLAIFFKFLNSRVARQKKQSGTNTLAYFVPTLQKVLRERHLSVNRTEKNVFTASILVAHTMKLFTVVINCILQ